MSSNQLKILLLCDYKPRQAATVVDHINAFYLYSNHDVHILSDIVSNGGNLPTGNTNGSNTSDDKKDGGNKIEVDLDCFDVIIIHYSLFIAIDAYISNALKRKLSDFKGLKVLFIQDEYRFVNRTISAIKQVGVDLLFTCIPEPEIDKVYPANILPDFKKVNVLTGYVPESLLNYQVKKLAKRKYDLSYRGREYPAWHGEQGREKWTIADAFKDNPLARKRLKMNISTKEWKRLYGLQWINLIRDSRAVLGVESGCSVFDFDGLISIKSEMYARLLGKKVRKDYAELRKKFFIEHEDKISLNQISPRIFETIALGSVMVLYEGKYSGIIEPWKHYLPLKKDLSNIEDIVDLIKDDKVCTDLIMNTYSDIALNEKYSYKKFIEYVDQNISSAAAKKSKHGFNSDRVNINQIYRFEDDYVRNPHGMYVNNTWLNIKLILVEVLPDGVLNFYRIFLLLAKRFFRIVIKLVRRSR